MTASCWCAAGKGEGRGLGVWGKGSCSPAAGGSRAAALQRVPRARPPRQARPHPRGARASQPRNGRPPAPQVGLGGASGSGKTAFSERVKGFMPGLAVISMDNYNDASKLVRGHGVRVLLAAVGARCSAVGARRLVPAGHVPFAWRVPSWLGHRPNPTTIHIYIHTNHSYVKTNIYTRSTATLTTRG